MYSTIGTSVSNNLLGSSTDKNHVIMNHVIKRLGCICRNVSSTVYEVIYCTVLATGPYKHD